MHYQLLKQKKPAPSEGQNSFKDTKKLINLIKNGTLDQMTECLDLLGKVNLKMIMSDIFNAINSIKLTKYKKIKN